MKTLADLGPKKLALIGALLLAFLWFVWPTPYLYYRESGQQFRTNRFTGITESSTDDGWRSEKELATRAAILDRAAADRATREKEAETKRLNALASPRSLSVIDVGGASASCRIAYKGYQMVFLLDLEIKGALKKAWDAGIYRGEFFIEPHFTDSHGLTVVEERVTLNRLVSHLDDSGKLATSASYEGRIAMKESEFHDIADWSPTWNWR